MTLPSLSPQEFYDKWRKVEHIRLYKNRFAVRPEQVDMSELSLGSASVQEVTHENLPQ